METTIKRKNNFLLCVDSDGCAIDSMNAKHTRAFCPELIRVYALEEHEAFVTKHWLHVNLFSATRGVNRFLGLADTLEALARQGVETEGWQELCDFVSRARVLSNAALSAELEKTESRGLALALCWSEGVNRTIATLEEGKPFDGCAAALASLHSRMDIAVVSSANASAVEHEWNAGGLAEHTDIRFGQEAGTKTACIGHLLESGYEKSRVLMVGDALGDLAAAQENGVLFYPILVGGERESWERLSGDIGEAFLQGRYAGEPENAEIAEIKALLA